MMISVERWRGLLVPELKPVRPPWKPCDSLSEKEKISDFRRRSRTSIVLERLRLGPSEKERPWNSNGNN
ncbi:hypothetical protein U1Q18_025130 [Sarracenia purpurea var. burkii]